MQAERAQAAGRILMLTREQRLAGAAAYPYMNLMRIVCLGLMWLRMAKASAAALAGGNGNADFHKSKLATARFYADRIMPQSNAERRKIEAGADSLMALPAEAF